MPTGIYKGKPFSEEHKKKLSISAKKVGREWQKGRKGELSNAWQGGISKTSIKRWRKNNYERVL